MRNQTKTAAASEIDDDKSPELEKVFDSLSNEELSNLSEYLKRIIEGLQEQFGGGFHHGWCGSRHDNGSERKED